MAEEEGSGMCEGAAVGQSDDIVTLKDLQQYVEEEEELAAAARAVLAPSESNTCTYEKGYMKRQALYSCLTCITDDMLDCQAAVCLPCAENCHDNHNLVELYTKRNIRCDCGNNKFNSTNASFKCKLNPCKSDANVMNSYNHNYRGLYCTCNRPYPDEEGDIADDTPVGQQIAECGNSPSAPADKSGDGDEMIQCVICEDWFHMKHLQGPPTGAQGAEGEDVACDSTDPLLEAVTCRQCTATHGPRVLDRYGHLQLPSATAGGAVGGVVTEDGACLLTTLPAAPTAHPPAAAYWKVGWRQQLCTCNTCQDLYTTAGVGYLLDEDDLLSTYEAGHTDDDGDHTNQGEGDHQDRKRLPSKDDVTLNTFLAKCDRVVQIEMINGFNDMKENLVEYLKQFAESGKVIGATDIESFFTQLQDKKRQKLDGIPSQFCK